MPATNSDKRPSHVLLYEAAGFLAIIALSWLNELTGLPYFLFGGPPHQPDLRECGMETVVVLLVAGPILLISRHLVSRLVYLEKFLKICAWCKKVDSGGRWVQMDQYLADFGQRSTHGMCPDCYKKAKAEIG